MARVASRGRWVVIPLVAWPLFCLAIGAARIEHLVLAAVASTLAFAGGRAGRLLVGLAPMGILGLVYDAMRFVRDVGVTPYRVHGCDLRAFEARWFRVGGAPLHDWLQAHATDTLDRLLAVPYATFIFVTIGVAVWLFQAEFEELRRFGWTFLFVNLAGFVTYHLYPAAPPWYVHARGCEIDLAAPASEGPNLSRVDAWLGVGWFRTFYGRSSDVFGAMPSLHVSYPLLCVLFGWRLWGPMGRAASVGFFVAMCVAAVYLDHHWVIDVVAGIVLTLFVERTFAFAWRRLPRGAESR